MRVLCRSVDLYGAHSLLYGHFAVASASNLALANALKRAALIMPRSSRLLLTLQSGAALLPRRTQRRTLFYGWVGFTGEGASALADAVKATDVRIAYLRHGNTEPNEVDFDRMLTKKGRWQAVAAAKSYGLSLRPFLPTALSSEAPRAVETARIFLEDAGRDVELVTDRSLYDGTMQPEGSAVFREIGYAPLDFYLKDGRANAVLGDYAETAAARVAATLAGFGQWSRRRTLVVVGHAIYLPAAALFAAEALGCDQKGRSQILGCDTQEAEGYLVEPDGSVSLLRRPR